MRSCVLCETIPCRLCSSTGTRVSQFVALVSEQKSSHFNTEERNCAAMPVTQVVATLPNTEDQVCATATQTSGQGSAAGVQQEWVACSVSNLTSIYVPPQFVSILLALDIEMQGVLHDCACC